MRLLAFFCHLPGLRLFYGYRAPPAILRANALALAATAACTALAASLAPAGLRLAAGLGVWSVGHVLWGAYLAWRIDPAAAGG